MRVFLRRMAALSGFVAALWIIQVFNWVTGYGLNAAFGLIPRQIGGLDGVVGMPFLHGSFAHLVANTPPLLLLGALLAATATRALVAMNTVVVGLGGTLVWLSWQLGHSHRRIRTRFRVVRLSDHTRPCRSIGRDAWCVGSGGSVLWLDHLGVLPGQPGVSWEAHLCGAIAGAVAAFMTRAQVHAPRMHDVDRP